MLWVILLEKKIIYVKNVTVLGDLTVPIGTYSYQRAPTCTNKQLIVPTGTCSYQRAPTHTNEHLLVPTGTYSYRIKEQLLVPTGTYRPHTKEHLLVPTGTCSTYWHLLISKSTYSY